MWQRRVLTAKGTNTRDDTLGKLLRKPLEMVRKMKIMTVLFPVKALKVRLPEGSILVPFYFFNVHVHALDNQSCSVTSGTTGLRTGLLTELELLVPAQLVPALVSPTDLPSPTACNWTAHLQYLDHNFCFSLEGKAIFSSLRHQPWVPMTPPFSHRHVTFR